MKVWAAAGAIFLMFEIYLAVRWFVSGNFKPTSPGPTPVPSFMKVTLVTIMVVGALATLAICWFMVVKPRRREGRLTTDGLFVIAFALLLWQDPLSNWLGPGFIYNAWMPNRGSWLGGVPGVVMPNAHRLAEPLPFADAYIWGTLGGVLVFNWLMKWM
ncbi:MAG TPA: spirocyclase AveC family protein, partial [Actinomycetota bacterium]|nr:spirocyclase AveC family protein [Actinomycetota bacterium]